MNRIPDTRQSLLGRVRDANDDSSWQEFVSIYRPAVLRFSIRRGLQLADAEDVTQRVFVSVARKMHTWHASPDSGSFRAWLLQVTRNAVLNAITRQPRTRGAGGTSNLRRLCDVSPPDSLDEQLEWEYRRAEFRRAAEAVRSEFETKTWQAFWMTAVDHQEITAVAKQLGKSTGSIYAARSRVMRRIKMHVEQQYPRKASS